MPEDSPEAYVFDSSPLSSFALVGELDFLQLRYGGMAKWTTDVQAELLRGATLDERIRPVAEAEWLGEAERLEDIEELREVERFRWALGGGGREPDRHRGEASTIVLAGQVEGTAVLDDLDARRLADAEGIPILGTVGILSAGVKDHQISPAQAADFVKRMKEEGQRLPSWADLLFFESIPLQVTDQR